MRGGYFTLGRWRRIPIRVHWSAFLGAIIWTGGELSVWRCLAFIAIIVAHELGHALLIRRARAAVLEVTVHAMGGECRWSGRASPIRCAVIAWGGVLAQLALAAATVAVVHAVPASLLNNSPAASIIDMLTCWNLYNAAFNLLPIRPLDGAEAWRLFSRLRARARIVVVARKRARNQRRLRAVEGELRQLPEDRARRTQPRQPD